MKKLVLFDMDGTVYVGNQLINGVPELFKYLKNKNINYVFITNNSSHDVDFYINKMRNMGVDCDASNFYTSIDATIAYLKKENVKVINALANECFKKELRKDFTLVEGYNPKNKLDAIVLGFNTELAYENLKNTCLYLETQDVKYLAANCDYRCPYDGGLYIPDCGGMAEMIRLCTGKTPTFLGKPKPDMINFLIEKFNVKKEDVLVVGDRLYTDIASGYNAGVETVCVLSGEATVKDVQDYEIKPTYLIDSVKTLDQVIENKISKYN